MLAEEIMSSEVFTVNDFDPLSEVLHFLDRRKIDGVPVVDLEQRLVGYFSAKKFMQLVSEEAQKEVALGKPFSRSFEEVLKEYASSEISEYMMENPDYLEADEEIDDVLDFLMNTDMEVVPVIKEGKVAGVIYRARFLNALLKNKGK
ncbi:MAG: hypothetical protein PWP60_338 [Candidatus Atribacteria bacterium]|uniref:CBS domain-containing protein n=1 Tax=Thermatribacter velox TaxID=3039681 RepID=A0ABZ2YAS6_9BACT|nr:hypothetical protein [Candidatus Atribacteria bacterium]MDI3530489.1 hypothetical protein [Candidatus Atribacteria bacterium]